VAFGENRLQALDRRLEGIDSHFAFAIHRPAEEIAHVCIFEFFERIDILSVPQLSLGIFFTVSIVFPSWSLIEDLGIGPDVQGGDEQGTFPKVRIWMLVPHGSRPFPIVPFLHLPRSLFVSLWCQ